MSGSNRFSYNDNGACLIIHDNQTGINRASCYSSEDAKIICNAFETLEKMKMLHENMFKQKSPIKLNVKHHLLQTSNKLKKIDAKLVKTFYEKSKI